VIIDDIQGYLPTADRPLNERHDCILRFIEHKSIT
jgi:hypothetical protein